MGINPALRTVFSMFFIHPLFREILDYAKACGYTKRYSPLLLFIPILFLAIISYSPDLAAFSYLACLFFIPPLQALNFAKLNSKEFNSEVKPGFSQGQIVLLMLAGLFWAYFIVAIVIN